MKIRSEHQCFDGTLTYYAHESHFNQCEMRFSAFIPHSATTANKVPVLTYLSGLTCTEENFTVKAGAYRMASALKLAIIAPDTSPRGEDVPDGVDGNVGKGAGFYVDAIEAPWNKHYHMYSYITEELYTLTAQHFPVDNNRHGIFGHSMGGHGALMIYLKNPGKYKSVSAFAPICSATKSPTAQNAFRAYFGNNQALFEAHDATLLMLALGEGRNRPEILIDQGLADTFLPNLSPDLFRQACAKAGQKLRLREHPGYDHGYFFIQSFIDDHIKHHAKLL